MNAIKALSALLVVTLTLGCPSLIAASNGNNEWQLGVSIVGTFDDILSAHQTAIDRFITEHKILTANTSAKRLDIIGNKTTELKTKVQEINETRNILLANLTAGEITGKEFAAEMRSLATDLASTAKSMGELGKTLGELGKELSGELKARAEALSDELKAFGTEMAEEGKAIAEEMSGRELPIPQNLPPIPEEVTGEGQPEGVPPEGIPSEEPPQVQPSEELPRGQQSEGVP